jgi:hypothetical protein
MAAEDNYAASLDNFLTASQELGVQARVESDTQPSYLEYIRARHGEVKLPSLPSAAPIADYRGIAEEKTIREGFATNNLRFDLDALEIASSEDKGYSGSNRNAAVDSSMNVIEGSLPLTNQAATGNSDGIDAIDNINEDEIGDIELPPEQRQSRSYYDVEDEDDLIEEDIVDDDIELEGITLNDDEGAFRIPARSTKPRRNPPPLQIDNFFGSNQEENDTSNNTKESCMEKNLARRSNPISDCVDDSSDADVYLPSAFTPSSSSRRSRRQSRGISSQGGVSSSEHEQNCANEDASSRTSTRQDSALPQTHACTASPSMIPLNEAVLVPAYINEARTIISTQEPPDNALATMNASGHQMHLHLQNDEFGEDDDDDSVTHEPSQFNLQLPLNMINYRAASSSLAPKVRTDADVFLEHYAQSNIVNSSLPLQMENSVEDREIVIDDDSSDQGSSNYEKGGGHQDVPHMNAQAQTNMADENGDGEDDTDREHSVEDDLKAAQLLERFAAASARYKAMQRQRSDISGPIDCSDAVTFLSSHDESPDVSRREMPPVTGIQTTIETDANDCNVCMNNESTDSVHDDNDGHFDGLDGLDGLDDGEYVDVDASMTDTDYEIVSKLLP